MNTTHLLRAAVALISLAITLPVSAQSCAGDVNGDGRVDGGDLGTMLSWWGPVVPSVPLSQACDLNASGRIDGGDLGLLLSSWGYCPASITDFSPTQGCLLGGTEITINGTQLGQASAVTVGGVACTGLTLVSPSVVKATVPAGPAGAAVVRVTTPAGTFTAPGAFTYLPQQIASIAPSSGVPQGGQVVTIAGQYLSGTTAVTFGGVSGTNLVNVSDSQVKITTPAGALGSTVDIAITSAKGTVTVPGAFTFRSVVVPSWATLVEAQPDPAVVTDPALRAAIVATGLAWRVRDTATQIEMLLVPPGTFQMGCIMGSNAYGCYSSWEQPVHTVTLTRPYYLGRYEVTQGQWTTKMGSNPSYFQGYSDSPSRPVEQVSWNTIQGFCSSTGVRLPTEAEWEYACRAGTQTPFYNGSTVDNTVGNLAWYYGNSDGQTHAVGGKAANAFGFHDMLGNVWEWVNDGFGIYSANAQTDPTGPVSASNRVYRGGSWFSYSDGVRSSTRYGDPPGSTDFIIGFRVARTP